MIDYFMKRPEELFTGADVVKILNHKQHGLKLFGLNTVQKERVLRLIDVVEDVTQMPFSIYCDKSRKREVVAIRHIAMWFLSVKLQMPLTTTGRMFDMDHSTVINARDNVSGWLLMRSMKYENEMIDKITNKYYEQQ